MNRVIYSLIGGLFIGLFWWNNRGEQKDEVFIGIVQTIEHPALDLTSQGVIAELKKAGYSYRVESAQGNPSIATQIAQKFVGQNAKLIVTVGTMATQAGVRVASSKHIPVVFATVTDPVGARIVQNMKTPEGHVTGVSNYVDLKNVFSEIKKNFSNIKTLGIIYNTGEANSVFLTDHAQKEAPAFNIHIELAPASKTSDVAGAAQTLIGKKVDAILINNDNTALAAFDAIVKSADNVPVIASDAFCLAKGAQMVVGANQFDIGSQAGIMVIKILKDKIAIKDIPVEGPRKVDVTKK